MPKVILLVWSSTTMLVAPFHIRGDFDRETRRVLSISVFRKDLYMVAAYGIAHLGSISIVHSHELNIQEIVVAIAKLGFAQLCF